MQFQLAPFGELMKNQLLQKRTITNNGCWSWTGTLNRDGYGYLEHEENKYSVYRLAYQIWHGPIQYGHHIDHTCRTRACFNPKHLEAVTAKENMRRMHDFWKQQPPDKRALTGTQKNALKTHCPNGHAYNTENTTIDNQGWRRCKTCKKERAAADYQKRKHTPPRQRLPRAQTHCPNGHALKELNGPNLLPNGTIRLDGTIACRACQRENQQRSRTKQNRPPKRPTRLQQLQNLIAECKKTATNSQQYEQELQKIQKRKEYYEKNKEYISQQMKNYREINKEKIKEQDKIRSKKRTQKKNATTKDGEAIQR